MKIEVLIVLMILLMVTMMAVSANAVDADYHHEPLTGREDNEEFLPGKNNASISMNSPSAFCRCTIKKCITFPGQRICNNICQYGRCSIRCHLGPPRVDCRIFCCWAQPPSPTITRRPIMTTTIRSSGRTTTTPPPDTIGTIANLLCQPPLILCHHLFYK